MYFFASRTDGVTLSEHPTNWRYGMGNVHYFPNADEPTTKQVLANLKSIVEQKVPNAPPPPRQLLLLPKYGKGITTVNDEFLKDNPFAKDAEGRILVEGDGLFTTKKDVLLLSKSGDAHTIILESPTAVGIVIGSWRCVKKEILVNMIDQFLSLNIDLTSIKITIGPGLGVDSYELTEDNFKELCDVNPAFSAAFTQKPLKAKEGPQVQKYLLDFVKIIQIFSEPYGITVDTTNVKNTYERDKYKAAKKSFREAKKPELLQDYYRTLPYFSARLYTKVDLKLRAFAKQNEQALPAGFESDKSCYDGTGRCLNGVML